MKTINNKYIKHTNLVLVILSLILVNSCANNPQGSSDKKTHEQKERSYAHKILNNHIVPLFTQAETQSKKLNMQVDTVCSKKEFLSQDYQLLKNSWKQAMLAWSNASTVNIDTVNKPYIRDYMYIYAFPDERKQTPRKVTKILNSTSPIDKSWAEYANVRQVGLVSMEYMIFNQMHNNINTAIPKRQCDLLKTQASLLVEDIGRHLKLWKGSYGSTLLQGTEDYMQKDSVLIEWFNSLVTTTRLLKDRKLGYASGFIKSGKIKNSFESEYAHMSVLVYKSNFNTITKAILSNKSEDGLIDYINRLDVNKTKLDSKKSIIIDIEKQIIDIQAILSTIKENDFNDVSVTKRRKLYDSVGVLHKTLYKKTPDILDIYVKFNQEDGD